MDINYISGESQFIYLSENTKILLFYCCIFQLAPKIFPLPLKKRAKNSFFGRKVLINFYSMLHRVYFWIKRVKYITCNKISTNIAPWVEFSGEKTWKMGNFQFCRFSLENTNILDFLVNYWNYHAYSGW